MRLIAVVISLLFIQSYVYAQFSWNLSASTGIVSNKDTLGYTGSNNFAAAEGSLQFQQSDTMGIFGIGAKIRPEVRNADNTKLHSLKTKFSISMLREKETLSLGIVGSGQRQVYNYEDISLDYSLYSAMTFLTYYIDEYASFITEAAYSYQSVQQQDTKLLFVSLGLQKNYSESFSTGLSLLAERFDCTVTNFIGRTERGTDLGIRLNFEYLKDFTVRGELSYIFSSAEGTRFPEGRQCTRFMAGKIIAEDYSLFMLADYTFMNLRNSGGHHFTYYSDDFENNVYIKAAYEWMDNYSLFLKCGFSQIIFQNTNNSLQSWSISLGCELADF
ncbi:MAG: hypothetical protein ACM3SM_08875 [Bacteroidota bacterium]